ncbi:hypothetical protein P4B35_21280, partial [Pontiellaceae bacterium B12227]|nr:hypothetical protein [Pontiellaceae bacterium B12227]
MAGTFCRMVVVFRQLRLALRHTVLTHPRKTVQSTNGADLSAICSAWSRQDACDTARTAAILAATR